MAEDRRNGTGIGTNGSISFLFLKGGALGGLNPVMKAILLKQLAPYFDIKLAGPRSMTTSDVLRRWGHTAMKALVKGLPESDRRVAEALVRDANGPGFDAWLQDLKVRRGAADETVAGLEFVLDYLTGFSRNGNEPHAAQQVMLKRRVSRWEILSELGFSREEARTLLREVLHLEQDIDEVDEQDFVKAIIVGMTNTSKSPKGTLRQLIGDELKKALVDLHNLAAARPGVGKASVSIGANGVHVAGTEELALELALMRDEDILEFLDFLEDPQPRGSVFTQKVTDPAKPPFDANLVKDVDDTPDATPRYARRRYNRSRFGAMMEWFTQTIESLTNPANFNISALRTEDALTSHIIVSRGLNQADYDVSYSQSNGYMFARTDGDTQNEDTERLRSQGPYFHGSIVRLHDKSLYEFRVVEIHEGEDEAHLIRLARRPRAAFPATGTGPITKVLLVPLLTLRSHEENVPGVDGNEDDSGTQWGIFKGDLFGDVGPEVERLGRRGILPLDGNSIGNLVLIGALQARRALTPLGVDPDGLRAAIRLLNRMLGIKGAGVTPDTAAKATLYGILREFSVWVGKDEYQIDMDRPDSDGKTLPSGTRVVARAVAGEGGTVDVTYTPAAAVGAARPLTFRIKEEFDRRPEGERTGDRRPITWNKGGTREGDSRTIVSFDWADPDVLLPINQGKQKAKIWRDRDGNIKVARWGRDRNNRDAKLGEDLVLSLNSDGRSDYFSVDQAQVRIVRKDGGKLGVEMIIDTRGESTETDLPRGTEVIINGVPLRFKGRLVVEQTNMSDNLQTSPYVETGFINLEQAVPESLIVQFPAMILLQYDAPTFARFLEGDSYFRGLVESLLGEAVDLPSPGPARLNRAREIRQRVAMVLSAFRAVTAEGEEGINRMNALFQQITDDLNETAAEDMRRTLSKLLGLTDRAEDPNGLVGEALPQESDRLTPKEKDARRERVKERVRNMLRERLTQMGQGQAVQGSLDEILGETPATATAEDMAQWLATAVGVQSIRFKLESRHVNLQPILPNGLDRLAALSDIGAQAGLAKSISRIVAKKTKIEDAYILEAGAEAVERLEATKNMVVIGPGSLHTSLMPMLITPGFVEALMAKKRANPNFKIVWIVNPFLDNETAYSKEDIAGGRIVLDMIDAMNLSMRQAGIGHTLEDLGLDLVINNSEQTPEHIMSMLDEDVTHYLTKTRAATDFSELAKKRRGPLFTSQATRDELSRRGFQIHADESLLDVLTQEVRQTGLPGKRPAVTYSPEKIAAVLKKILLESGFQEDTDDSEYAPPHIYLMTGGTGGNFLTSVVRLIGESLREEGLLSSGNILRTHTTVTTHDDGGSSRAAQDNLEPFLGYFFSPGDVINAMTGPVAQAIGLIVRSRFSSATAFTKVRRYLLEKRAEYMRTQVEARSALYGFWVASQGLIPHILNHVGIQIQAREAAYQGDVPGSAPRTVRVYIHGDAATLQRSEHNLAALRGEEPADSILFNASRQSLATTYDKVQSELQLLRSDGYEPQSATEFAAVFQQRFDEMVRTDRDFAAKTEDLYKDLRKALGDRVEGSQGDHLMVAFVDVWSQNGVIRHLLPAIYNHYSRPEGQPAPVDRAWSYSVLPEGPEAGVAARFDWRAVMFPTEENPQTQMARAKGVLRGYYTAAGAPVPPALLEQASEDQFSEFVDRLASRRFSGHTPEREFDFGRRMDWNYDTDMLYEAFGAQMLGSHIGELFSLTGAGLFLRADDPNVTLRDPVAAEDALREEGMLVNGYVGNLGNNDWVQALPAAIGVLMDMAGTDNLVAQPFDPKTYGTTELLADFGVRLTPGESAQLDALVVLLNQDITIQPEQYKAVLLVNLANLVVFLGERRSREMVQLMANDPAYFMKVQGFMAEAMVAKTNKDPNWFLGMITNIDRALFLRDPEVYTLKLLQERNRETASVAANVLVAEEIVRSVQTRRTAAVREDGSLASRVRDRLTQAVQRGRASAGAWRQVLVGDSVEAQETRLLIPELEAFLRTRSPGDQKQLLMDHLFRLMDVLQELDDAAAAQRETGSFVERRQRFSRSFERFKLTARGQLADLSENDFRALVRQYRRLVDDTQGRENADRKMFLWLLVFLHDTGKVVSHPEQETFSEVLVLDILDRLFPDLPAPEMARRQALASTMLRHHSLLNEMDREGQATPAHLARALRQVAQSVPRRRRRSYGTLSFMGSAVVADWVGRLFSPRRDQEAQGDLLAALAVIHTVDLKAQGDKGVLDTHGVQRIRQVFIDTTPGSVAAAANTDPLERVALLLLAPERGGQISSPEGRAEYLRAATADLLRYVVRMADDETDQFRVFLRDFEWKGHQFLHEMDMENAVKLLWLMWKQSSLVSEGTEGGLTPILNFGAEWVPGHALLKTQAQALNVALKKQSMEDLRNAVRQAEWADTPFMERVALLLLTPDERARSRNTPRSREYLANILPVLDSHIREVAGGELLAFQSFLEQMPWFSDQTLFGMDPESAAKFLWVRWKTADLNQRPSGPLEPVLAYGLEWAQGHVLPTSEVETVSRVLRRTDLLTLRTQTANLFGGTLPAATTPPLTAAARRPRVRTLAAMASLATRLGLTFALRRGWPRGLATLTVGLFRLGSTKGKNKDLPKYVTSDPATLQAWEHMLDLLQQELPDPRATRFGDIFLNMVPEDRIVVIHDENSPDRPALHNYAVELNSEGRMVFKIHHSIFGRLPTVFLTALFMRLYVIGESMEQEWAAGRAANPSITPAIAPFRGIDLLNSTDEHDLVRQRSLAADANLAGLYRLIADQRGEMDFSRGATGNDVLGLALQMGFAQQEYERDLDIARRGVDPNEVLLEAGNALRELGFITSHEDLAILGTTLDPPGSDARRTQLQKIGAMVRPHLFGTERSWVMVDGRPDHLLKLGETAAVIAQHETPSEFRAIMERFGGGVNMVAYQRPAEHNLEELAEAQTLALETLAQMAIQINSARRMAEQAHREDLLPIGGKLSGMEQRHWNALFAAAPIMQAAGQASRYTPLHLLGKGAGSPTGTSNILLTYSSIQPATGGAIPIVPLAHDTIALISRRQDIDKVFEEYGFFPPHLIDWVKAARLYIPINAIIVKKDIRNIVGAAGASMSQAVDAYELAGFVARPDQSNLAQVDLMNAVSRYQLVFGESPEFTREDTVNHAYKTWLLSIAKGKPWVTLGLRYSIQGKEGVSGKGVGTVDDTGRLVDLTDFASMQTLRAVMVVLKRLQLREVPLSDEELIEVEGLMTALRGYMPKSERKAKTEELNAIKEKAFRLGVEKGLLVTEAVYYGKKIDSVDALPTEQQQYLLTQLGQRGKMPINAAQCVVSVEGTRRLRRTTPDGLELIPSDIYAEGDPKTGYLNITVAVIGTHAAHVFRNILPRERIQMDYPVAYAMFTGKLGSSTKSVGDENKTVDALRIEFETRAKLAGAVVGDRASLNLMRYGFTSSRGDLPADRHPLDWMMRLQDTTVETLKDVLAGATLLGRTFLGVDSVVRGATLRESTVSASRMEPGVVLNYSLVEHSVVGAAWDDQGNPWTVNEAYLHRTGVAEGRRLRHGVEIEGFMQVDREYARALYEAGTLDQAYAMIQGRLESPYVERATSENEASLLNERGRRMALVFALLALAQGQPEIRGSADRTSHLGFTAQQAQDRFRQLLSRLQGDPRLWELLHPEFEETTNRLFHSNMGESVTVENGSLSWGNYLARGSDGQPPLVLGGNSVVRHSYLRGGVYDGVYLSGVPVPEGRSLTQGFAWTGFMREEQALANAIEATSNINQAYDLLVRSLNGETEASAGLTEQGRLTHAGAALLLINQRHGINTFNDYDKILGRLREEGIARNDLSQYYRLLQEIQAMAFLLGIQEEDQDAERFLRDPKPDFEQSVAKSPTIPEGEALGRLSKAFGEPPTNAVATEVTHRKEEITTIEGTKKAGKKGAVRWVEGTRIFLKGGFVAHLAELFGSPYMNDMGNYGLDGNFISGDIVLNGSHIAAATSARNVDYENSYHGQGWTVNGLGGTLRLRNVILPDQEIFGENFSVGVPGTEPGRNYGVSSLEGDGDLEWVWVGGGVGQASIRERGRAVARRPQWRYTVIPEGTELEDGSRLEGLADDRLGVSERTGARMNLLELAQQLASIDVDLARVRLDRILRDELDPGRYTKVAVALLLLDPSRQADLIGQPGMDMENAARSEYADKTLLMRRMGQIQPVVAAIVNHMKGGHIIKADIQPQAQLVRRNDTFVDLLRRTGLLGVEGVDQFPHNSDRERAIRDLLLSRPRPGERPHRLDQVRAELYPDGYRAGLFPHRDRRDNPRFWVENRTRTLADALDELNELGKTYEARLIIDERLAAASAQLTAGQTLPPDEELRLRLQEFSEDEKARIDQAGLAFREEHLVRANHYIRQSLDWVPDYLDGHQLREELTNDQFTNVARVVTEAVLRDITHDPGQLNTWEYTNREGNRAAVLVFGELMEELNGNSSLTVEERLRQIRQWVLVAGAFDLNSPDMQRELREYMARGGQFEDFLRAKIHTGIHRRLADPSMDQAWDEFVAEFVTSRDRRTATFATDNNFEAVADLYLIQELRRNNPNFKFYLAPKSVPASNDATWMDVEQILSMDRLLTVPGHSEPFGLLQEIRAEIEDPNADGVVLLRSGPRSQGFDIEYMGTELTDAVLASDIIITKGQSNAFSVQGKDGYGIRKDRLCLGMGKGEVAQGMLGLDTSFDEKPLFVMRLRSGVAVGTGPRKRAVIDPHVGSLDIVRMAFKSFDGPNYTYMDYANDLRRARSSAPGVWQDMQVLRKTLTEDLQLVTRDSLARLLSQRVTRLFEGDVSQAGALLALWDENGVSPDPLSDEVGPLLLSDYWAARSDAVQLLRRIGVSSSGDGDTAESIVRAFSENGDLWQVETSLSRSLRGRPERVFGPDRWAQLQAALDRVRVPAVRLGLVMATPEERRAGNGPFAENRLRQRIETLIGSHFRPTAWGNRVEFERDLGRWVVVNHAIAEMARRQAAGETWSETDYVQELQAAGVVVNPIHLTEDLSHRTETRDEFLSRLHQDIGPADRAQFEEAVRLLEARSASLAATVQAADAIRRGTRTEPQSGTFTIPDVAGNETLGLVARALTGIFRPAAGAPAAPSSLPPPLNPSEARENLRRFEELFSRVYQPSRGPPVLVADMDGTLGLRRGRMAPEMALAIIDFVRGGGEFYLLTGNDFASAQRNFLAVLYEMTRDELVYAHIHVYSSTSERYEYDRSTGEYRNATYTNLVSEMRQLDSDVPNNVEDIIENIFKQEIISGEWEQMLNTDSELRSEVERRWREAGNEGNFELPSMKKHPLPQGSLIKVRGGQITVLMGGSNATRGTPAYEEAARYYDKKNRRSYIAAYLRARYAQLHIPLKVNVSAGTSIDSTLLDKADVVRSISEQAGQRPVLMEDSLSPMGNGTPGAREAGLVIYVNTGNEPPSPDLADKLVEAGRGEHAPVEAAPFVRAMAAHAQAYHASAPRQARRGSQRRPTSSRSSPAPVAPATPASPEIPAAPSPLTPDSAAILPTAESPAAAVEDSSVEELLRLAQPTGSPVAVAVPLPHHNDALPNSIARWQSRIKYRDVPSHPRDTAGHPSENKYATALYTAGKAQEILDLGVRLRSELLTTAAGLGIEVTDYARSESWALWDIGKQLYLQANRGESNQNYRLADPLTDQQLQQEIVDRMLGWVALGSRSEGVPSHTLTAVGRALRERLPQQSLSGSAKSVFTATLAATAEGVSSVAGLLTSTVALFALVTGADVSPLVQLVLGMTAVVGTWFTFFLAGPRALFHWQQSRMLRTAEILGSGPSTRAPPSGAQAAALGALLDLPEVKALLKGIRVDFAELPKGVAAQAVGTNRIQLDARVMTASNMSFDQQISIIAHEAVHLKFRKQHPTLVRVFGHGSAVEEVMVSWSDVRTPLVNPPSRVQSLQQRATALQTSTPRVAVSPRAAVLEQAIPAVSEPLSTLNLSAVNVETLSPSAGRIRSLSVLSGILSGDVSTALGNFDRQLGTAREVQAFADLAHQAVIELASRQSVVLQSEWARLSPEQRQESVARAVQAQLVPLVNELTMLAGLTRVEVAGNMGREGFAATFFDATVKTFTDHLLKSLAERVSSGAVSFFDFVSIDESSRSKNTVEVMAKSLANYGNVASETSPPVFAVFVENPGSRTPEEMERSLKALLEAVPGVGPSAARGLGRVNLRFMTPSMPGAPQPQNGVYEMDEIVAYIVTQFLGGKAPSQFQAYTLRPTSFRLSWRSLFMVRMYEILDGDVEAVPFIQDTLIAEAVRRFA